MSTNLHIRVAGNCAEAEVRLGEVVEERRERDGGLVDPVSVFEDMLEHSVEEDFVEEEGNLPFSGVGVGHLFECLDAQVQDNTAQCRHLAVAGSGMCQTNVLVEEAKIVNFKKKKKKKKLL